MLVVRKSTSQDTERWDDFVLAHPEGTLCHLWAWQRIVDRTFGHPNESLVCEEEDRVVAILPLFLVNTWLSGKILVSSPLAVYGGILAAKQEAGHMLLEAAIQRARDLSVDYLELRQVRAIGDDSRLNRQNLYVTFIQELFEDLEENYQRLPRDTRRMIRLGIKHGLIATWEDTNLTDFYNIYSTNVRNLGTPVFPRSLFRHCQEELGDRCKILIVRHYGKPASGVMTFLYKDRVLPYYGGSYPGYKRMAVNNFMYWQIIKWGNENGFRIFDFGRSKKGTGAFHFKESWNMQCLDLGYQDCLIKLRRMPGLNPLNPKYRPLIALWKWLPLGVANLVGPWITRGIP